MLEGVAVVSDCPAEFIYVAITGRPGVGKTTVFRKVYETIVARKLRVIGFYCPEIREQGRRIGFKIKSIDDALERWLARVDGCDGPPVGRYTTCSEAAEVADYVVNRLETSDVIMIDEIGPMELKMKEIKKAIIKALDTRKPGIFVVHERLRDKSLRKRLDGNTCWFQITLDNRDYIIKPILDAVNDMLTRTLHKE